MVNKIEFVEGRFSLVYDWMKNYCDNEIEEFILGLVNTYTGNNGRGLSCVSKNAKASYKGKHYNSTSEMLVDYYKLPWSEKEVSDAIKNLIEKKVIYYIKPLQSAHTPLLTTSRNYYGDYLERYLRKKFK